MEQFTYDIQRSIPPNTLSAVIGADSFFYGVFDKDYHLMSCDYIKDVVFDAEFKDQIAEKLLPYEGLSQKVTFTTKPFLHVPNNDISIANYFPAFDDKLVSKEKLTAQEVRVIYGLKSRHISFLEGVFKDTSVYHISTVLNNASYPNTKPKLHLLVDGTTAHLLASDFDKLLYYNQFECGDKTDFLYFTMMAYEVLGYDPNEVPLQLSGRVSESSELYKALYPYVKNIEFASHRQLKIDDVRFRAKKHYYHDLYSTAICGL